MAIPGHPKHGGKKKGTLNRITRDIIEKLDELGCDPIEGLALIALDSRNPVKLRAKCFSDIAQYVYPRRVAQTIGNPDGSPVNPVSVMFYIPDNGRNPANKDAAQGT